MRGALSLALLLACLLCGLLACEAHSRPSTTPLGNAPANEPDGGGSRPRPAQGEVADAGVLELLPLDADAPRQDAGGTLVEPEIEPPRQALVAACIRPGGRTVSFLLGGTRPHAGGPDSFAVYEDERVLRRLALLGRLGAVDPSRQRLVRIWLGSARGASVAWVTETDRHVVIGLDLPATCGALSPFPQAIDVVLPSSRKPVRVQYCSPGDCLGLPKP